jgi:hypothetical protein
MFTGKQEHNEYGKAHESYCLAEYDDIVLILRCFVKRIGKYTNPFSIVIYKKDSLGTSEIQIDLVDKYLLMFPKEMIDKIITDYNFIQK